MNGSAADAIPAPRACAFATPCIELSRPDGARAVVALFGAQLLSWQASDRVERLYLSPNAVFDGRTPIRGGVPICFPQFNMRGSLPKHGIARALPWQPEAGADPGRARLRLRDSDATRRWWPQAFDATLDVTLAERSLRITFEVSNTDQVPWSFALALHSYLRVAAIEDTRLAGLRGRPYWDAVEQRDAVEQHDEIAFAGQFDRVYRQLRPGAPLELRESGRRLLITQSANLTEAVVWNPGAQLCATLPDLPPEGFRQMLCVEAAKVDAPELLGPGQRWQAWQQFEIAA